MRKTHLYANSTTVTVAACGRYLGTKYRGTQVTSKVTCLNCKESEAFALHDARQRLAAEQAFEAQEPREYREPWREGVITCDRLVFGEPCKSTQFRYKGRSCYGHYDDYQCAKCRGETSRLTETGMSA